MEAGRSHDELAVAQTTARELEAQLDALIAARSRAEAEARRLAPHAARPETDRSVAEVIRRYESQSAVLTSEIAILRATLRGAQSRLERLRAGG